MRCELCGGATAVVDSRPDTALDGGRVRTTVWALGEAALRRLAPTAQAAGMRLRVRRCRACGHEQATVELTAAQFEEATR